MSDYIEVIAIVEGKTEQVFVERLLVPYLAEKNIYMNATQVSKPGEKGGDVRFVRVKRDLGLHLKQRADTYVTTLIDYYGTKEWPGLETLATNLSPSQIAQHLNDAVQQEVNDLFPDQRPSDRFIPFMALHEFEALLFSDSEALASGLNIDEGEITAVLEECGEPEAINNSPQTAPSKRLDKWANGKFGKTTTGIAIAQEIGIPKMREKCPLFNAWLEQFEALVEVSA
jgi:Domain of unknown function (DUF4276)